MKYKIRTADVWLCWHCKRPSDERRRVIQIGSDFACKVCLKDLVADGTFVLNGGTEVVADGTFVLNGGTEVLCESCGEDGRTPAYCQSCFDQQYQDGQENQECVNKCDECDSDDRVLCSSCAGDEWAEGWMDGVTYYCEECGEESEHSRCSSCIKTTCQGCGELVHPYDDEVYCGACHAKQKQEEVEAATTDGQSFDLGDVVVNWQTTEG